MDNEVLDSREGFPGQDWDEDEPPCYDCPHCNGTGLQASIVNAKISCAYCNGTGIFQCETCGSTHGKPILTLQGRHETHLGCTLCSTQLKRVGEKKMKKEAAGWQDEAGTAGLRSLKTAPPAIQGYEGNNELP
jgi:DnaJ-class molecular chaperone